MNFRRAILTGLAAIFFLTLPSHLSADVVHTYAEVVCRKNADAALVRFTWAWNEDAPAYRKLPSNVDLGLSRTPPSGRSDCTMPNGWKVRARSGDKQAFAYGMGGAGPPSYFSLWIARRKVVSRKEWKPGYGNEMDPWIVAVVVRPDRLTYCRVPDGTDAPAKGNLTCLDEPFRLDRYKVDTIEYARAGTRPPLGTMLVLPGSPEPKLCSEYLRLRGHDWPETYMMVDSAKILRPISTEPAFRLSEAIIEVAPGVRRKLIDWGADNHFFDGDLMFLAPVSADARANVKPDTVDHLGDSFPKDMVADTLPKGWQLISGGQAALYPDVSLRYVHFDTQKIRGSIYLLAQPTNREDRPTAILVQPLASGFRTVCRFQRVERNF